MSAWTTLLNSQPIATQAGIVTIQAVTMLPATPQWTARRLPVAPTPMMLELMTWVVEIGMPRRVATSMIVAAVVSAAKPWIGFRLTILWPIVLMMRQPPIAVPSAIAVAAARTTHS